MLFGGKFYGKIETLLLEDSVQDLLFVEMKDLIKQIDAKMVREAGLFLALAGALYVILKLTTNDISHLQNVIMEAVGSQGQIQKETNEVLRDLSANVQANTEVLKILERR